MSFSRNITEDGVAAGFDSIEHIGNEMQVFSFDDDFDFLHGVQGNAHVASTSFQTYALKDDSPVFGELIQEKFHGDRVQGHQINPVMAS